jgi:type IV secretion system protein VirB6
MSNIVISLFDKVDTTLQDYVLNGSTDLINYISPIFNSLILLWVVIWGYMLMYGRTNDTLSTASFKILQIGIILTVGLTAATYNTYIASVLTELPNTLGAVLTSNPIYSSGQAVDQLFSNVFIASANAWNKGGVLNGDFGMYLIALVIGLFGIILAVIATALILLSKIALAVVLVLGPIAIIMLLFQATQRFFESWLGMAINLTLIYVMAVAVASIIITLADKFVSNNNEANLDNAFFLSFIFGLSIIVMKQVEPIASALGGGIALSTQGAIRNGMSKLRPSNINRARNKINNDATIVTRQATSPIVGTANLVKSGQHAYQRKFGKGNSISS